MPNMPNKSDYSGVIFVAGIFMAFGSGYFTGYERGRAASSEDYYQQIEQIDRLHNAPELNHEREAIDPRGLSFSGTVWR